MSGKDGRIKPINKASVHRICSGQVIFDLATAVKELVENALDAGATNIEIRLKEYGAELIEVADNGCGVQPDNYSGLTLKYHTSKISDFHDLESLGTFGFRGEALSSLCALAKLTVTTKTSEQDVGCRLEYDHEGVLISQAAAARAAGTTVAVRDVFKTLPVRYKEFQRNVKREFGRLSCVLQAYAVISTKTRILATNQVGRNKRTTLINTMGVGNLRGNIVGVFGAKTAAALQPLQLEVRSKGDEEQVLCRVTGFVSKARMGCGRPSSDQQFFFLNGRPVDLPKVGKLLNETYKSLTSVAIQAKPIAFLDIQLPTDQCDVNVTPDKRTVFLQGEEAMMAALAEKLQDTWEPSLNTYEMSAGANWPAKAPSIQASLQGFMLKPKEEATGPAKVTAQDVLPAALPADNGVGRGPPAGHSSGEGLAGEAPAFRGEGGPSQFDGGEEISDSEAPIDVDTPPATRRPTTEQVERRSPVAEDIPRACRVRQAAMPFAAFTQGSTKSGPEPQEAGGSDSDEVDEAEGSAVSVEMTPPAEPEVQDAIAALRAVSPPTASPTKADTHRDDDDDGMGDGRAIDLATPEMEPMDINGLTFLEARTSVPVHTKQTSPGALGPADVSPGAALDRPAQVAQLESTIREGQDGGYGLLGPERPWQTDTHGRLKLTCNLGAIRDRWRRACATKGRPTAKRPRDAPKADFSASSLQKGHDSAQGSLAAEEKAATEELERAFDKTNFKRMRVVGQFNLGFIIARLGDDCFIVDQHASDEKRNFERLQKSTVLNKQPMLRPQTLHLTATEEITIRDNMAVFQANGFEFRDSDEGLQLTAVPFSKNTTFGVDDVQELCTLLEGGVGAAGGALEKQTGAGGSAQLRGFVRPSKIRAMLAMRACRSSIMIGRALDAPQMRQVLDRLADLESPWNCPHGRPTMRHLCRLTDPPI